MPETHTERTKTHTLKLHVCVQRRVLKILKMVQAKDVNMGKRPLTDFQDPKMKGNIVTVDFESILQIAVLCVASSSTGRPTIDLVVEELDKALKNTKFQMVSSQVMHASTYIFTNAYLCMHGYISYRKPNFAIMSHFGWVAESKGEELICSNTLKITRSDSSVIQRCFSNLLEMLHTDNRS